MTMLVCSTDYLYHYTFNYEGDKTEEIIEQGLRPLSDFPDGDRWKQLEAQIPDFYKNLYAMLAEPILRKPYDNSGVFVTPIDFYKIEGTYLSDKPRFVIPIARIDPKLAIVTYVIDDERVSLPFSQDNLHAIRELWTKDLVSQWFARDKHKVFFYVPQVATYQQGGIPIETTDLETPPQ